MISLEEATIMALTGKLNKLTEGIRDIDREKDQWKLTLGQAKNLSDLAPSSIKHYATYQEYSEVIDILENYTDKNTRIKLLNDLKNSIDYRVKFAQDYADTDQKYIDIWLKYYKEYIDKYISKLDLEGKYFITLDITSYDERYEKHTKSPFISINNGKFVLYEIKFYDNKAEAEKDKNSISKSELDNYIRKNLIGEFTQSYDWELVIHEYSITNDILG